MKIPVIRIYKKSIVNVFSNKLNWLKVGFAPLSILLVTQMVGAILKFYGLESILIYTVIPYILIYAICEFSLYINGYRFALFNEGRDNWWNPPNINRISLMLVYTILVYSIVFYFGLLERWLFDKATSILGMLSFLLFTLLCIHVWFRLSLVYLLVSIDVNSPMRESWRIMKGNVLRMWLLTFLFWLPILVIIPLLYVFGLNGQFDSPFYSVIHIIIICIIVFFVRFFYWAIFAKASSLIYLFLQKKDVNES